MNKRFLACLLIATLSVFHSVGLGQDDIQLVGAVWRDFAAALRRGDYANAHALFSPESRKSMPYEEFVAEYGPLSAAREVVLVTPERLTANVTGDWAEILFGGTNPATGQKFSVWAALVRNGGSWGLVAARNEALERTEAVARELLGMVWAARDKAGPRDLVAALNAAQAGNPVLRSYRMETDGKAVRAFPLAAGLRTFYLDGTGVVRAVGEQAAERTPETIQVPASSALPPQPPLPEMPVAGGLPEEMAEPGVRRRGGAVQGGLDSELAEPQGRVRGRPTVTLPDTIQ